jgi:hypothetical protein
MSEVWAGDNESNKMFKLQKLVLWINSDVINCASYTQIFKDYAMLTLSSLYILEVICFI